MSTIDQSIARVRSYAATQGWTKSRLAKEADLNDTTLRDFDTPDWNPTAKILRQLEGIVPKDFDPAKAETSKTDGAAQNHDVSPPKAIAVGR